MSNRIVRAIVAIIAGVLLSPIYVIALITMIVASFLGGMKDMIGLIIFTIKGWACIIKEQFMETKSWIEDENLEYKLVNVKETGEEG